MAMNYKCMNPFEFTLPTKIIFGPGCVKQLAEEIAAIGGKKPLIITDPGIRGAGIDRIVTDLLEGAGIEYGLFDGVEANPKDVNAEAARSTAPRLWGFCLPMTRSSSNPMKAKLRRRFPIRR